MMMICLPPQGTPPPPSSRYADMAHSTHSTQPPALRPHRTNYLPPRAEDKPPHDAPTPLKRSMLTPFGGPRPRFGAKARERWFTHSNGSDLKKKKKKKKRSAHIIVPGWLWRPTRRSSSSRTSRHGRVRGLALPVPRSSHGQCCCCAASGYVCNCDGGVVIPDGNPSSGGGGSWCI